MHAEHYVTQLTAERPPQWRRFPGWRGRARPVAVSSTRDSEIVWVSCSPWTVHYVRVPARP